jgi:hypothetical protein
MKAPRAHAGIGRQSRGVRLGRAIALRDLLGYRGLRCRNQCAGRGHDARRRARSRSLQESAPVN